MLTAKGRLSEVSLHGENLTIIRFGTFAGIKSLWTVKTSAIASIDFKPATTSVPGYIDVHVWQIGENFSKLMFRQDRPSCARFLFDESENFHAIAAALGAANTGQEHAINGQSSSADSEGPRRRGGWKTLALIFGGVILVAAFFEISFRLIDPEGYQAARSDRVRAGGVGYGSNHIVSAEEHMASSVFEAAAAANTADPQQTLMKYCMARNRALRDAGIIKHGGARPGVMPGTWKGLTEAQRREVIELAACIDAGGMPGPIEGVVVQAGLPNVTLESANVEVAWK